MRPLSWVIVPIMLVIGECGSALGGIEIVEFSNSTPITIVDNAIADPYPSTISVGDVPVGEILAVQVLLNGFTHTYPDDVAAVVVAPSGSAALLFSGAGREVRANDLNFVFDDRAASQLPLSGALASGTYRPGAEQWDDFFPAPGPGGKLTDDDPAPWAYDFNAWLSENPRGDWNIFVLDASPRDSGSISGGWGLRFEINVVPEPGSAGMLLLAMFGLGYTRRR